MFPNRSLLRLFHPSGVSLMRKPPQRVCTFHKTALGGSKTFNFLNPLYVLGPHRRKFRDKLTSAELRELKKSLVKEAITPVGRVASEATDVQKHYLRDFIHNNTSASDEDWDTVLQNVSSSPGYLNEFNIHGTVMENCAYLRNLDLAKSYLRYLKKKGIKFNQAVAVEFINTCYVCQDLLTEEDIKIVRSFTSYLINNFKVMDKKLGSSTIKGFSVLGDWKKCLEVVGNLEKSGISGTHVYSPLITCLFKNQQYELARETIYENLKKKRNLSYAVYAKWIEAFQHDADRLEELLNIFKDYDIVPKKFLCDNLIQAYSKLSPEHRLEGEFTTVKFSGQCNSCRRTLEKNILNDDEFKEVRDTFLNRVLVSNDVFKNTSPKELQSFYKVVKIHAPFDVVIDGLNVMYCKGRHVPGHVKASLLLKVVDTFFNRDKKIFIIGRKHMRRLPRNIMDNIMEKSAMFLIDDVSEDDPFIVYATLYGGPKCYFVSRDYLRSEKFRLSDDRLADLFKRWQLSRQMVPQSTFDGNFHPPIQFRFCTQRTSPRSWHVPYHDDNYTGTDLYEKDDLTKWLCLRK